MRAPRYLTKSRFKVGYECPTKLFYLDDKSYGNNKIDNSFLSALAEGGFQVGELAKLYYPGGTEITSTDKDGAAIETAELLTKKKIIIYEAAFKYENLFIKADVVVKNGDYVELIEVKAKSFDSTTENPFYNKTSLKKGPPKLNSTWEPYLVDVAFQTYVLKKAFPKLKITSSLMLADKTTKASVDGLNQRFFLEKSNDGKTSVRVAPDTTSDKLGDHILVKIGVDSEVKLVWDMIFGNGMGFEQFVNHLSKICANSEFEKPKIGSNCKSCEYRIGKESKKTGLRSGFEHCWTEAASLKTSDFEKPFIFEVWNFRKNAKLIEDGKYFIEQLTIEDISPTPNSDDTGLSNSERQWKQVEKIQEKDNKPYIDFKAIDEEINSWKYLLHFIDFETSMVAIPFNKGRRPYEQIAFQFSHHEVSESGKIIHKDEYINRSKGHFPNFDFVRALKNSLSNDNGTIFRYATHENTVLCQIRDQLLSSDEHIADKDELINFIESITASTGDSATKWVGPRNMVDLCELVKKYYYHPSTTGSNSIKKVLPAILNASKYLQNKYSAQIYGSINGIISKNFENWSWIHFDQNGKLIDPYKKLPPIFSDLDLDTIDSLITDGSIADGGAAMTAYARMQFTDMSEQESEKVAKALLKYCELDTFAMVLIYEYWFHEIDLAKRKRAA
jgi:hypothetical protein